MVKSAKASYTVEAALLCPFLCLVICGMLQFTLRLYQRVNLYATEIVQEQEGGLPSPDLIRLEAMTEEIF